MPNLGAPELLVMLIVVALWVLFIAVVAGIARRKGRSAWMWAVLALFFSWITLIIVLVLPTRTPTPPPDH